MTEASTPAQKPVGDQEAFIRSEFPGTEKWAYFDVAARGLLPKRSRAAVEAYFDTLTYDGGDKPEMFRLVESARARFADLIGAHPEEIAITKNVSEGINIIAAAFPWRNGDNLVLCEDREHPNNIYAWLNIARRYGVEVRKVPSQNGQINAEALIQAFDRRTRLVTTSSVSFHPGLQTNLDMLTAACAERDIFLLVDAVQSAGVMHLDVKRTPVDALAVSTQKGLLALYGMGFLYCRRAWAERLEPAYLARFGVDLGQAHEADVGVSDYKLMPAAQRFDLGNYNFAGAAAVDSSLKLLLEVGTEAIEAHVRGLTKSLAESLAELGLPVIGMPFGSHFANMVTIEADADGGTAPNARLHDALVAAGVKLSIRRGALRFSSHFYNTQAEVEHVVDTVRKFLRTGASCDFGTSGNFVAGAEAARV